MTPVDRNVSHALIESLVTEVVVGDRARTDAAFGIEPIGLDDALAAALDDQLHALDHDVMSSESGLHDGIYVVRVEVAVPHDVATRVDDDFDRIGGSYDWYGLASAWRARALLGRLVGEAWPLEKPPSLAEGDTVDWWRVTRREPGTVVLRSTGWFPGEGWLGYRIDDDELVQVGAPPPEGRARLRVLEGAPGRAPPGVRGAGPSPPRARRR